jgi:hypothetical protein
MKLWQINLLLLSLAYTTASPAQTCQNNIEADAPNSRYVLNRNGTLVDKHTGLMWMRCALGQTWASNTCSGSVQIYSWQSALKTAESTVFAEKQDWRLPNQAELQSLAERRCINPAINITAFPNTISDWFWSSTPVSGDSQYAWKISFSDGNLGWNYRDNNYSVRLVRGGR